MLMNLSFPMTIINEFASPYMLVYLSLRTIKNQHQSMKYLIDMVKIDNHFYYS
jgi:hypothetical protein